MLLKRRPCFQPLHVLAMPEHPGRRKCTMRCKHGDLAIIVKDFEGCEGNLGLIVKVVGPAEHHPDTELIC